jgi:cytoskeletal protein RodZ
MTTNEVLNGAMNDAVELVDFEVIATRPKRKRRRKSQFGAVLFLAVLAGIAVVVARRMQAARQAQADAEAETAAWAPPAPATTQSST